MVADRNGHHSKADLEALKDLLIVDPKTEERDYLKLQARCIQAVGPAAGVFLRELVFWTGRGALENGWIWKTEQEMEEGTGLSRTHQRKARKILAGLGVLEEARQGVPRRMHYRVNLRELSELLEVGRPILNQWKRGAKLNKETGKFHRPETGTLNPEYREDGSTDLTSRDGNTDLASEVPITNLTSEDGITNLADEDRNTVLAIQRELQEGTPEASSEISSEGSPLQGGAEPAFAEPAPAPRNNTSSEQEVNDLDFDTLGRDVTTQQEDISEGNGKSRVRRPKPPRLSKPRLSKLDLLMNPLPGAHENPLGQLVALHLNGGSDAEGRMISAERIAERAREVLGEDEPIAAYIADVERVLETMKPEEASVHA